MHMKKTLFAAAFALTAFTQQAVAADYIIDEKGAHASINFKIQHLGYSWLTGRFDKFSGTFSYDPKNPQASSVKVNIDPASLNSNHAERDKHLKSDDFLDVSKFKTASFVSTSVADKGNNEMAIKGNLTLHGVTKEIVIDAVKIGEGSDPWGGYRAGFSGTTRIALKDFGIMTNLGPASTHVDLELHVEGIKK